MTTVDGGRSINAYRLSSIIEEDYQQQLQQQQVADLSVSTLRQSKQIASS